MKEDGAVCRRKPRRSQDWACGLLDFAWRLCGLPLRDQQFAHPLVKPFMRLVLHPMSDTGHDFERSIGAKLFQAIAPFIEMRCGGRVVFAPDSGDPAAESRQAA